MRTWTVEPKEGVKWSLTLNYAQREGYVSYVFKDGEQTIFEGDDFRPSIIISPFSDRAIADLLKLIAWTESPEDYSDNQRDWLKVNSSILEMVIYDLEATVR